MGKGLSRAVLWLAGCAIATVVIVAWLTSKVEMSGEERQDAVVGVAAVVAFCAAALALSLRQRP